MIALYLLLACGNPVEVTPTPPQPAPEGKTPGPPGEDPKADACRTVLTANDANALFTAGRSLPAGDGCTFEDVGVKGSVVDLAFQTSAKVKVPLVLTPRACVDAPADGAVVGDTYVLTGVAEARASCPTGVDALAAAVTGGTLPPPSKAE